MNRTLSTALTFSLGLVASTAALADPVAGAIIGGGAGAAPTRGYYAAQPAYYLPVQAYYPPQPAYYPPTQAYYPAPPAYYPPQPVYYPPRQVYYAPPAVRVVAPVPGYVRSGYYGGSYGGFRHHGHYRR